MMRTRSGAAVAAEDINCRRPRNAARRRLFVALMLGVAIQMVDAADDAAVKAARGGTNSLVAAAPAAGGRQMNRYKWFAQQAAVPVKQVNSTLRVGDQLTIDLGTRTPLSREQTKSVAKLLGVPTGVVARVFSSLTNQPPPQPPQFAQQLRTAVIDYKFLAGEWNSYKPQGEQQRAKAKALELLQAGELAKVWDLYDRLPLPDASPAPTNVRIVGP